MITQEYLQVENNVVTNILMWDGDVNTWQPPADAIMLVQATTPSMVWLPDDTVTPAIYKLTEIIGFGSIGFTWDGTVLTTNQPEPTDLVANSNQPIVTGIQTI